MLSLMLRNMIWAAWWPASTWLLALEKATHQAENFWQQPGSFWQPMLDMGNFWQPMADTESFWQPQAGPSTPGAASTPSGTPAGRPTGPEQKETGMVSEAFRPMEMPESLRDLMKMGIEQARYAFETFASTTEQALKTLETSSTSARHNLQALNEKIAEIGRKNAEANFDLAMKMAEAADFNQALSLQSEHMKAQMETFATQIQEIRDLAAKTIQESTARTGEAAEATPPASPAPSAPPSPSANSGFGGPGGAMPGGEGVSRF